MAIEGLYLNRVVALGFGLLYWGGVAIQARRVRKRIGRSPNVRPRGVKENLLWAGWSFVVVVWLALPFLSGNATRLKGVAIIPSLVHPVGSALGVLMMGAGYAITLWCYVAMGNAWRMGINRTERIDLVQSGPYRFLRHPIYACQVLMVAAVAVLLPSALSFMILGVQLVCVLTKAADEESHLRTLLGQNYAAYCSRTRGWFPRLFKGRSVAASLSAGKGVTSESQNDP